MTKCSNTECERDVYGESDKCILHCSKDGLDFFDIRLDFFTELDKYVASNKNESGNYCCFIKIAFPMPDIQSSDYNYINLLKALTKIHFKNCEFFASHIDLDDLEIFFDDCLFHDKWTLVNYSLLPNVDNVIYHGCKFAKKVETHSPGDNRTYTYSWSQFDYSCIFEDDIVLRNATFDAPPFKGDQENSIENSFVNLLVNDCSFSTFEMYLLNQQNAVIKFNRCTFDDKLKIRSVERNDYEYQQNNKSKLKALNIVDCNVRDKTYSRIGFLEISDFVLSNLRNRQDAELNIGDCRFDSFKLRNFRNLGKFKLFKINVLDNESGRLFQIDNTSIGDTDFQSINLTSFSKIRFFDNLLANINYTNMQWKETVEVGEYNDDQITKLAKLRDTYRILKNVAQKNNDQPQALLFYAKEMEHHKKLTIENRCKQCDFARYYLVDIFCKGNNRWLKDGRLTDIITLVFNERTNNFGLNWWQPIWCLSLLTIVFYSMLLFSFDTQYNPNYWENIFVFLNPAHSAEFIADKKWTFSSYLIDFSFRIVEGLLIYQTIIAFRKYSRK